jgi:hypothetical protein
LHSWRSLNKPYQRLQKERATPAKEITVAIVTPYLSGLHVPPRPGRPPSIDWLTGTFGHLRYA